MTDIDESIGNAVGPHPPAPPPPMMRSKQKSSAAAIGSVSSTTKHDNSNSSLNTTRLSPAALFGVKADDLFRRTDAENAKSIRDELQARLRLASRTTDGRECNTSLKQWLLIDKNIAGRIQSGPSCGLVALRMCVEHLLESSSNNNNSNNNNNANDDDGDGVNNNDDYDDATATANIDGELLLSRAVELGYSKLGEMFSSEHLAALSNDMFEKQHSIHARVVNLANDFENDAQRLAFVAETCANRRQTLLVPYDADKDNTPCAKRGFRAHWAIVKGVLVAAGARDNDDDDDDGADELRVRPIGSVDEARGGIIDAAAARDDVWLVCIHSKSKRVAVWHGAALLASSAQLSATDDARRASGQYVMPTLLDDCLASRLVLVEKR
jgi:hypothetical protein